MIFINNKYTKIYFSIITSAQCRLQNTNTYYENHHIIPACFFTSGKRSSKSGVLSGDLDSADNLVMLTAKEHFVCHHLLTKMTTGIMQRQMWHALRCILRKGSKNAKSDIKITSRLYEVIKVNQAIAASLDHKDVFFWNNRKIQLKSKTCPGEGFIRGRLPTNKVWWTTGVVNTLSEHMPEGQGWVRGRTLDKSKVKWTNGVNLLVSATCPGDGWYRGGLRHTEETKLKIKEKRKLQTNIKGKKNIAA